MSMRKRVAKGMSYAVAPKLTFAASHPAKAAAVKAAGWAMDRVQPSRRRKHRRSKMAGFGAAAMMVPVGIWLGRRFIGDRENHPAATY